MNEMRERLIEIIKDEGCFYATDLTMEEREGRTEKLADALIAAGAILPKFKVGQKVYYEVRGMIYSGKILAIEVRMDETYYALDDDWGDNEDNFFATEAEAREALKGDK